MAPLDSPSQSSVVCIGAGPAGLTAAYLLAKAGWAVTVLEQNPRHVGGISRTEEHGGYRLDIGGHRFFSKSAEVNALWQEMLGEAFLTRPRKSRIFYRGKFYPYPLDALKTLRNLGFWESFLCGVSYLQARLRPIPSPRSFEEWVTNQFGARLYRTFFKTYTEKVWGMSCRDISADWAAQRIKGLSLAKAVKESLFRSWKKSGTATVKTLIHEFYYPRLGPGMMWEAAAAAVTKRGGKLILGATATSLTQDADRWEVSYRDVDGQLHRARADCIINSMPLASLVQAVEPSLPETAHAAAKALRYRDFLVIGLVVQERHAFDDQWLYIHDPGLKVGRIQNFKSWSPAMVPDEKTTCYGMEYFCFENDGLWSSSDEALIAMATRELVALGLAQSSDVLRGIVIRQPKAYPVYDDAYRRHVDMIRATLAAACPGLYTVGRNGMHKYNNQDHAMMTAMLTVRNLLEGSARYDVWNVNEDAEYHEAGEAAGGLRAVPTALR